MYQIKLSTPKTNLPDEREIKEHLNKEMLQAIKNEVAKLLTPEEYSKVTFISVSNRGGDGEFSFDAPAEIYEKIKKFFEE